MPVSVPLNWNYLIGMHLEDFDCMIACIFVVKIHSNPGHFHINLSFKIKKIKTKIVASEYFTCKFFFPQLKRHSLLILRGGWDGKGSGEASSLGACSSWIVSEKTQDAQLAGSSSTPSGYPGEGHK